MDITTRYFCTDCGHELLSETEICEHCNLASNESKQIKSNETKKETQNKTLMTKAKTHFIELNKIKLVLAIIGLGFGIAGIVYLPNAIFEGKTTWGVVFPFLNVAGLIFCVAFVKDIRVIGILGILANLCSIIIMIIYGLIVLAFWIMWNL